MGNDLCCVCGNSATSMLVHHGNYLARQVECPRCGKFFINSHLADYINGGHTTNTHTISKRQRAIASSIIRQSGEYFFVNFEHEELLFTTPDIPILEKVDKLLLFFEKQSSNENGFQQATTINFDDLPLHAECWAINSQELKALCSLLIQKNFLMFDTDWSAGTITAKGWERLDQLRITNKDSAQGFVAMWFSDEVNHLYDEVFAPAIKTAGYAPHRVDKREHADKIDDEIILQIRKSRFVVANATGNRGGVYYEAGFGKGLGLEVFWTCRKGDELHFDVRQYNCIFWEPDKLNEFRTALARRIEAVLGRGPKP